MSLALMLLAMIAPPILAGLDRSRALAAVRYLSARMAIARAQAVSRSTNVALRFEEDARGVHFAFYMDGNGNGVRNADIQALIDPLVESPVHLSDLFPGVGIGLTSALPGAGPVQVGRSALLSFSPTGTATSGSVYVRGRDGTQWAVRVLGATARTRVLRYVPATAAWVTAF